MSRLKQLFFSHVAQTSPAPLALHITRAEGCYLYDETGKSYLDLIGGIAVSNTGHCHPRVVAAVQQQAAAFMHTMVYGELVQSPQVAYATLLANNLPASLSTVYFTNSGAEAVEGAIKLSRRLTGRTGIIACNKSYHGSTTGALALLGDEYWRNAFRPLMPGVRHLDYGSNALIEAINADTACVVLETVQAEAGVNPPPAGWLKKVKARCEEKGALLVLDEIQCGFGRIGSLWAFEQEAVTPDILLLGKALGGGMPLGAFIASQDKMKSLTENPVLGHITTFGGHPVSCAAGLAAMQVLLEGKLVDAVAEKAALFQEKLKHPAIKTIRHRGLMMALELESSEQVLTVINRGLELGVFADWFLFAPHCIRLAPPLTISKAEIEEACKILLDALSGDK